MGSSSNGNGSRMVVPVRNHYFYGKLMDVAQFEKEQRYFNQKRLLINRLVIGSGVICGLSVTPGDDGNVLIEPGAALDGLGREIIVPQRLTIDPSILTDDDGLQMGDPLDAGEVDICLAYAELKLDPVPVLVPDCETDGNCAHSTIGESFRILVRLSEADPAKPPDCGFGQLISPVAESLHELLCDRIGAACPETAPDTCVQLARVSLPLNDNSIDSSSVRRLIYNNNLLYELLLCLSEQVTQLSEARMLRYVSGDGQKAKPEEKLASSLVVELLDGKGDAVEGALVQFTVTEGEGKTDPETATTDKEGRVEAVWVLGAAKGEHQVTAGAVGSAYTVTFRAEAVADK